MRAHALHAETRQVLAGRRQADRLGDGRGARLELHRQLVPRRGLELDGGDHVAAGEERRHALEQLAAPVQHADAGRPERLVPRPGVEVCVDRRHVDRHLGDGLRAVDQRHGARRAGSRRDLGDGVDRPQHVRDVREGE